MADGWLLLLLILAIAIGWLLGRGLSFSYFKRQKKGVHAHYYQGLNFLLNDQPDPALDSFIMGLEVTSETLETHIAVGNLMRRKGEVESAIRIHQNLLAGPNLPGDQLHQAHLELARDYIGAGLLDRAEGLLKDLVVEAPELADVARHHLLEIYQDEKEWQEAVNVAQKLLPRKTLLNASADTDSVIETALAHYCCELAEQAQKNDDYHDARTQIKQALNYDGNCVRASLLLADIEIVTGHYDRAIKSLRRVAEQDADFIPETIKQLKSTHQKLDSEREYHEYLLNCLSKQPSASVLLALVEDIQARQGDEAAAAFISSELKRRPSLRGLGKLVALHIDNSTGPAKQNLTLLQKLFEQLLGNKARYQCRHCGFSGKQLHWLCPSCKQWGQVKSIRGAEGE